MDKISMNDKNQWKNFNSFFSPLFHFFYSDSMHTDLYINIYTFCQSLCDKTFHVHCGMGNCGNFMQHRRQAVRVYFQFVIEKLRMRSNCKSLQVLFGTARRTHTKWESERKKVCKQQRRDFGSMLLPSPSSRDIILVV